MSENYGNFMHVNARKVCQSCACEKEKVYSFCEKPLRASNYCGRCGKAIFHKHTTTICSDCKKKKSFVYFSFLLSSLYISFWLFCLFVIKYITSTFFIVFVTFIRFQGSNYHAQHFFTLISIYTQYTILDTQS